GPAALLSVLGAAERERACSRADLGALGHSAAADPGRAVLYAAHDRRGGGPRGCRPSLGPGAGLWPVDGDPHRDLGDPRPHSPGGPERFALPARGAPVPPLDPTADVLL